MISKIFIHRPRLAFVISLVLTIAGAVAIGSLPVSQYPNIVPPQVQVSSTYTGASASVVEKTVVEPLENQINGVEDMIYMSSTSGNDGSQNTMVTFYSGTNGDMNTVNTQNRVSLATPRLPDSVKRQGITVQQKSTNMLLVVNLYSPKRSYDAIFLSNYALIYIQNELLRIRGVASATILGEQEYSMRVWLDPDKLASLSLTPADVTAAIQAQNVQAAAGQIGLPPTPAGQANQLMIQIKGRLEFPNEFEEIVIKARPDGSQIKVKDIGKVEMGAFTYQSFGERDGMPGVNLAIYQLADANGLDIANAAYAKMAELKKFFPPDLDYSINYDTTKFVKASIHEVVLTLLIAVALVIGVVFIFLQDWRAVLIPTLAVPVSLVGTFAALLALGYSINLTSLFGLILAIGIVVDDAIIVVENCNRLMEEEGMGPVEAIERTMEQVTGPILATTLVLLAMFIPVCFLPGISGALYRQFAVTISCSVFISAINALTLSPALCATLLKPGRKRPWMPFRLFNRFFSWTTRGYVSAAGLLARRAILGLLLLGACVWGCSWLFGKLPTGFIPDEDTGVFFVNIQLPEAASVERTYAAVEHATKLLMAYPGVEHVMTITGYNMIDQVSNSNNALMIVVLKDWDQRKTPDLFQAALMRKAQGELNTSPLGTYFCFALPAIPGLGTAGGLAFILEDLRGVDPQTLGQVLAAYLGEVNKRPEIGAAYSTYSASVPQIFLEIDREKVMKLEVSLSDVFNALQAYMGAYYVNDFNRFGQVFQVMIQADGSFRNNIADILGLYVKSAKGKMVPIGTFATAKTVFGPQNILHYNMYQSARITAIPAKGGSTGQAMAAMEEVANTSLPDGFKFDWTDMSYQELQAAGKTGMIFVFALIFIYLFLVGQYESWMIPLAVLLSVPGAFLGSLAGLYLLKVQNNIYTQIGFVLLFGMACKTAILIVEFAKTRREEGMGVVDAAMLAGKTRFRAVVMTGLAFVFGVAPLVVAIGAGAASRRSLGTAVFGGMIAAAILGTLMTPMFYVVVQWLREKIGGWKPKAN